MVTGVPGPEELRKPRQWRTCAVLPAGADHDQPHQPHRRGRHDQLTVSAALTFLKG